MKDVSESLSKQLEQEKLENRRCFLKVLSCIRFLGRQGLALRGLHGDETNSNFIQLMKFKGEDDPHIATWLAKKANKYTSPEVQNEILQIMYLNIIRQKVECLHTVL